MRDDNNRNSGQRSSSSFSQSSGSRPQGQGGGFRPQGQGGGRPNHQGGGSGGGGNRPAGGGGSGGNYGNRPAGGGSSGGGYGNRPPHAGGGGPRPVGAGAGGAGRPMTTAPRRPQSSSQLQRPQHDGPRMNDMITVREVLLIDQDGNKVGNMAIREALGMAQEAGLDLVEIAPNAEPPVCKIMDYGKHKYQEQKKAAEARKKQKIVEVKEIKMRPNIDDHDYDVKMKAIMRFLEEGDKVKITLRFRGRELSHTDIGMKVLEKVQDDVKEAAKIEQAPKVEGRQAVMVIAPLSAKS